MNSSTFSSESSRWRGLLARYAASTMVIGAALAALLLVLDPYDTGRFTVLPAHGVANFGQRLALASLARRTNVDTAIVGDSTIQLIDPERLSHLTGHQSVSLAVPGSGPLEHLALADYFRRHHQGNGDLTIVFGIDQPWCTTANPIIPAHPFPFWLYSNDRLDYVLNMMRYKTIEAAVRRLKLLAGLEHPARPDGYHDYDTGKVWRAPEFSELPATSETSGGRVVTGADFTAVSLLRQFLSRLDPRARVVLLVPPRYISAVPRTGTAAATALDACKNAFRRLAEARLNTWILDLLVDGPVARREEDFWDIIHYRQPVARMIEDRLADILGS